MAKANDNPIQNDTSEENAVSTPVKSPPLIASKRYLKAERGLTKTIEEIKSIQKSIETLEEKIQNRSSYSSAQISGFRAELAICRLKIKKAQRTHSKSKKSFSTVSRSKQIAATNQIKKMNERHKLNLRATEHVNRMLPDAQAILDKLIASNDVRIQKLLQLNNNPKAFAGALLMLLKAELEAAEAKILKSSPKIAYRLAKEIKFAPPGINVNQNDQEEAA